jgi:hypothetical protein
LKGGKIISIDVGVWMMDPEPDAIVDVLAVECEVIKLVCSELDFPGAVI